MNKVQLYNLILTYPLLKKYFIKMYRNGTPEPVYDMLFTLETEPSLTN